MKIGSNKKINSLFDCLFISLFSCRAMCSAWYLCCAVRVCLFVCLFVCFNHLWTLTESYPENFDLAEILGILEIVYLFVCLFLSLFVSFFYLNHLGIPPERFSKIIVKIRLELSEIFMIEKKFKTSPKYF